MFGWRGHGFRAGNFFGEEVVDARLRGHDDGADYCDGVMTAGKAGAWGLGALS
jgi:hypothetical protein